MQMDSWGGGKDYKSLQIHSWCGEQGYPQTRKGEGYILTSVEGRSVMAGQVQVLVNQTLVFSNRCFVGGITSS